MNIAIFTPNQNPYSETFIQVHKLYLKDRVFYYYGSGNINLEGQSSLTSSLRHKWYFLKKIVLRKKGRYIKDAMILYSLKQHKIDVVLVEYGTHAHSLLPILKAAKLPFVVHFHGYDASIELTIKQCNYYKEVFAEASKIVAVSKVMEQKLLDLGCPKEKLVYNVYGPQPGFEAVVPQFSKPQFVAIGRFTDKKAPYYTILAFKEVVQKYPDAQLLLAGSGVLLNVCKNLVLQYGLEKQVKFLGVISPEAYRDLLTESLAFVQHSITAENGDMEGTPLAVLEASAAGLPVISTYHAGIPDVIIHNETGLLCDEHDVHTMGQNMLRIYEDRAFAKQLGAAGSLRIREHFSLQRHIQKLQDILEEAKAP